MPVMQPLTQAAPLTDEVTTQLRIAILNGTFAPGEKIRQADVARQLGVSRGPVREALRSLIAEGLVQDEPRRGTFVTTLTPDDVREIFDVRVALEVRAAQLVIANGNTEATVADMSKALDDMEDGLRSGDQQQVEAADVAFHAAHVAGSANQRLIRLYAMHSDPVRQLLRMDNRQLLRADEGDPRSGGGLIEEHRAILAELQLGAAGDVAKVVTDHIEDARDRLIRLLGTGP
jgi:DNA-binding GntR family transcriptional regulator